MARSMGLDMGDRRIGVALGDPGGMLATPLTIVVRGEDEETDCRAIADLITQNQVDMVIVGLPYNMDGSLGQQAEKVKAFMSVLSGYITVSVAFRDERLSTVSARRMMRAAGGKKGKEKAHDDAIAAAIILQGYLDEIHPQGLDSPPVEA